MRMKSKNNNNNIQKCLFSCTRNTAFWHLFFFFWKMKGHKKCDHQAFPELRTCLFIYQSVMYSSLLSIIFLTWIERLLFASYSDRDWKTKSETLAFYF